MFHPLALNSSFFLLENGFISWTKCKQQKSVNKTINWIFIFINNFIFMHIIVYKTKMFKYKPSDHHKKLIQLCSNFPRVVCMIDNLSIKQYM